MRFGLVLLLLITATIVLSGCTMTTCTQTRGGVYGPCATDPDVCVP